LRAAVAAPNILSETADTGTEHVVSTTAVHDILHNVFIPLWEFNIRSSDAFALPRSGLNEFLFAPVGAEANGMTLSVVSVFARLGTIHGRRLAGWPDCQSRKRPKVWRESSPACQPASGHYKPRGRLPPD
jgi:hypothetical protein